MKEPVYKIVQSLLDSMPNILTISATNIIDPRTVEITVCDPLWAHPLPCKLVSNGGNDFTITNIVSSGDDYVITLSGLNYNVSEATTLKMPTFFHGTTRLTNIEMQKTKGNISPTVYLYEVLSENFYSKESLSALEREANVRLFFLTSADPAKWTTDCHYENAIEPMAQMAHHFVNNINNTRCFNDVDDYKIIYHANFGNYDRKGHFEKIFDKDHFSGVELSINIQKRKSNKCIC